MSKVTIEDDEEPCKYPNIDYIEHGIKTRTKHGSIIQKAFTLPKEIEDYYNTKIVKGSGG